MALIPNIVDQRARSDPESLYAEYPRSVTSYDEGYQKITIGSLANAVNGVAWWLQKTLGRGEHFETLAYIGPNDLRYPALILGAVKAGYTLFLTSPRNSVAAQIELLKQLKCVYLLSPDPRPPPVTAILTAHEIRVVEVSSVRDLLETKYPHYPYNKEFEEVTKHPLFAVHTSGSTGIPKPIIYTHDTAVKNMNMISLAPPKGFESQDNIIRGKRVFLTFPPFHGAYIVSHLFNAIPFGTVMIAPTSGNITSAEGLVEALRQTPADIAFLVPSIVKELSQNASLLEYCADNLDSIIYCGGDLPRTIGDIVASKIRLLNQFGATELGLTPNLLSPKQRVLEDWKYVQFHPDLGIEFRLSNEGMHELYVVRDSAKEGTQPTFTIFPTLQEYGSRDLFLRHPSKEKSQMWTWCARADDIIVFLNGEKTNPISMEQYIVANNQDIDAALVLGAQRFQAALLIEPAKAVQLLTTADRARFLESIWGTIEDANIDAPAHARIAKSHVLFTHPQKPVLRAGKGTIQRSGTLSLYTEEIEALYADAEKMTVDDFGGGMLSTSDLNEDVVTQALRRVVSSSARWKEIGDMDDFFSLGMDSLQALTTLRNIKRELGFSEIALSTIYTNPTISSLTEAILRLRDGQHENHRESQIKMHLVQADVLREYMSKVDQLAKPTTPSAEPKQETVLLTGSTGALGSFILDSLLINKTVAHVYCLNRATNSQDLQISRNRSRGLDIQLSSERTTFIAADLTRTDLGVSQELLSRLKQSVTLVIHNAWPVNFNLNLQSFRPQLDGLVNLMGFVTSAAPSPILFFVSSIGSVMSHQSPSGRIAEEAIHDDMAADVNGYSQSKHLAETLLEYAKRSLSMRTSFARVGQIAGAVDHSGVWNKAEWFPSLVISSLHLGAIPDSLGPVFGKIDWVPIDKLADVLTDLALDETQWYRSRTVGKDVGNSEMAQDDMHVFHPLNPYPVQWESVKDTLVDELSLTLKKPVEMVSLKSWCQKVRKDSETAARSFEGHGNGGLEAYVKRNPAVKLLDFYEGTLSSQERIGSELEIGETLKKSEKLRALESINAGWIRKWVREWITSS